MIPEMKGFGHSVTSQVKNDQKITKWFFVDNSCTLQARAKRRTPSCSSQDTSEYYDLTPKVQGQNLASGHVTSEVRLGQNR